MSIDSRLPDDHILLARLPLESVEGLEPDRPRAITHARKAVTLTKGGDPEALAVLDRALAFS